MTADNNLNLADSLTAEMQAIQAESIGWLPLEPGVYLHHGEANVDHEDMVIQVVGIPDACMAAMNVLLLLS